MPINLPKIQNTENPPTDSAESEQASEADQRGGQNVEQGEEDTPESSWQEPQPDEQPVKNKRSFLDKINNFLKEHQAKMKSGKKVISKYFE